VRLIHLVIAAALAGIPAPALSQGPNGDLSGVVTTQGDVRLPGAEVIVKDASGTQIAQLFCAEDGRFHLADVPPGRYSLSASLAGFDERRAEVEISPGKTAETSLDLEISTLSTSVDVVAPRGLDSGGDTISNTDTIGGRELDQLAPNGGLQASLRLLASIIQMPNGVSIKGGRPSQAGLQLGPGTLVDPATGLTQVVLPDGAIDSVSVLPNPYEVEYGRFSSGLVLIQTRRAGDEWKIRLNNLDPAFRTNRGSPIPIAQIGWWAPRVETGGPLIKDRLFLEETAQYRYSAGDVPSLPPDLLKVSEWFSSFTRVDANLSPRHSLVATAGIFPSVFHSATLGTFTPPDATVDLHVNGRQMSATDRVTWTDSLYAETSVQTYDYQTGVEPQGLAPMRLLPQTTLGNFYNQQRRDTTTYQLVEAVSGTHGGLGGLHLFKFGADVLRSQYDGTSISRSVFIERTDGTLARRLDFSGPTLQSIGSTDVALFAQDRFQPNTRWSIEFGGRLDRDGITDRFNFTPRIGVALRVNDSGSAILRGGWGLFYERTPSVAGTFGQFESAIDSRYEADGETLIAPPITFVHTTAELETPRSRTLDLAFEYRMSKQWSLHVGGIDRDGSHELIVTPEQTDETAGEWLLSSTGRSSYRDVDVGVKFTHGTSADLNVSYARSMARGDLNTLTNFFGAVMWPVIGANAYAPAASDVPNRLLARGRVNPTPRWLLLGILDWRSGLPYSAVNEMLDFVGPRNSLRFPTYLRLEVGVERRVKVLKFQPWVGIRVWNALDSFLPTDVQANLGSPAFGQFYNSEYRQYRIQIRFER
jgi:Carboxypeptidase regulatory-like domain/TonB dependent receptor-like, beta-barrel